MRSFCHARNIAIPFEQFPSTFVPDQDAITYSQQLHSFLLYVAIIGMTSFLFLKVSTFDRAFCDEDV